MAEDEKKYTQDQVNKMLAQKDKESFEKGKNEALASFEGKVILTKDELAEKQNGWLQKGEERSKMSAEEKAQAELKDQKDSLAAAQQAIADQQKSMEADKALYATQSKLSELGLDTSLAQFVSDVDESKRDANIQALQESFKKSSDAATKKALEGQENPQAGDNTGAITKEKHEDVKKMTLADQMAWYQAHPEALKQDFN